MFCSGWRRMEPPQRSQSSRGVLLEGWPDRRSESFEEECSLKKALAMALLVRLMFLKYQIEIDCRRHLWRTTQRWAIRANATHGDRIQRFICRTVLRQQGRQSCRQMIAFGLPLR